MPYEDMSPNITQPTQDNYHAILFVGVCNRERYVRSLIRWTNLLHEMCGYPLSNIRILVATYSNSNWSSMVAGTDVTYNATRNDLDNALADYAQGSGTKYELGTNDNLFIFTFNHGGQDTNGCYLCCENFNTRYYASDFASRMSNIHCRQIVLLAAQCHSGGFVDPFIGNLHTNTKGAVMAGCRDDQTTHEAVFDKLFASVFNGRMIQNSPDDNIDLGITGEGDGINTVPGYKTDRIDWGPDGVISTREAFNWVYDHYVSEIYANYGNIDEIPLYRQKPWIENGKPVYIRLGEPDLILQDCSSDTGDEPTPCSNPWHSPDLYPDNSDQFTGVGQYQYVPAHHNRFFCRVANRGTAPTDNVWRILEVRGLAFTGGPVGPLRIDKLVESNGSEILSARIRPRRAHSQYNRVLIGGDFGHGCVSAAVWYGNDGLDHNLWQIREDNDQAQCNLNAASISGSTPVPAGSTNSNAGTLIQPIQFVADLDGLFEVKIDKPKLDFPVKIEVEKPQLRLKRGEAVQVPLKIEIKPDLEDGLKGYISGRLVRGDKTIGGFTFLIKTATAYTQTFVHDSKGLPVPKAEVYLKYPGDPRKVTSVTDERGFAKFGPLNPGFYFANVTGNTNPPIRVHIREGKRNPFKIHFISRRKSAKKKSITGKK